MTINEVAKKFDLTQDTLRYWERVGLLPPIKRTASGYRDYSAHDLNWIFYIKALRKAGMTVEELIEFVQLYRQGDRTIAARKALLVDQQTALRAQQTEIKKTIAYLTYKIDHFEDHTLTYEKEKLAYDHGGQVDGSPRT